MASEVKSGVILNYIRAFVSFGIGFFISPIVLAHLGAEEYGLYAVAGSIIGWLALCDLGLSAATTKFVSEYQAKGDREGEAHYLGNVAAIFSVVGLIVLVLGLAIYPFLDRIFDKFTPAEMQTYRILYLITLVNTALCFPARSLGGISAARQKFLVPGIVGTSSSLLGVILTLTLLHLGFKSIGLTLGGAAMGLGYIFWNLYYCFGVLKARMSWRGWDIPLCKSLFGFSIWLFLDQLIYIMNIGSGNLIVGMTQGAGDISVYSYGVSLMLSFMSLTSCISGVFLPRTVRLVVNGGSNEEQTDLMAKVGRVQLILCYCALFGILFFGREFFRLWIGDSLGDRSDTSWLICVILLLPNGLAVLQALGWQILQARNTMRHRVRVLTIISIASLAAGYIAARFYGITALAISSSLCFVVGQIGWMNYIYSKKLGLNIPRFFRSTFGRAWLWLPLLALAGWGINALIPSGTWPLFFTKAALFTLAYAATMYACYMSKEERASYLPRWLGGRRDG